MPRFCGSCGSPLQPEQSFCIGCGAPAGGVQPVAPVPGAAGPSRESGTGLLGGVVRWVAALPIPISPSWFARVAQAVEGKRALELRYPVRVHPIACGLVGLVGAYLARDL